ncbi:MAG: hypothetical protein HQL59_06560 [Magnetococcales bacterium]|nr:hypothetical protein [Magnetococcales bacterium]
MKTVFAHTIGRADLIGGVIRCELNSMVPCDSDSELPVSMATHALILPVDGFLRAFATLEELVRKLTEAKVIGPLQERVEYKAEDEAVHEAVSSGAIKPPTSPNFI